MRRAITLITVFVVGVAATIAAFHAVPAVDGRWRSLDATRDASVADRLARSDRAPLLFVPDSIARDHVSPTALVVTLPGLDGIGRQLAEQFVDAAEARHWLLLAPSPVYDPVHGESLASADLRVDDEIAALIDHAILLTSAPLAKVSLVGFSRGAQSAHRFALRHPERVAALASFSAGTYTMPTSQSPYPLGIGYFADWDHGRAFDPVALREVQVLVGVGALDEVPSDVVRAWDEVGGTTRVERAARFTRALRELSVPVRFELYPGIGHRFVTAMRDDAVRLLGGL